LGHSRPRFHRRLLADFARCREGIGGSSGQISGQQRPSLRQLPDELDLFMEKHGLSRRAAQVILHSNGPSRIQCDAAAEAFVRFKQWREDARMKPPSPSIKSSIGAPSPLPQRPAEKARRIV
ncbi:hypothetical protein EN833_33290, partial [Mesorhizobium sp. M4B.F.Ca.ET.190.01.1.1]|uniref:hypothetical protein n=1 Tax=unclassified Mesorhizobium TaxID=325217 RepID=UPI0010926500